MVSQCASEALGLAEELRRTYPKLVVKSLVGADSGETKRQMLSNINETLKDTNIFIYSPVLEAGVDITVKVKKLYGMLCAGSNSPRAYLQMLARCRNVEEATLEVLSDLRFAANHNYCFWRYHEVLDIHRKTVRTSTDPTWTGGSRETS